MFKINPSDTQNVHDLREMAKRENYLTELKERYLHISLAERKTKDDSLA